MRYLESIRLWRRDAREEDDARKMLAYASAGIGEVVTAAERAVAQMRAYDQAAGEGEMQINSERLVQELRSVLERTEGLRAEAEELAQDLDRAGAKLQDSTETAGPEPEPFADASAGIGEVVTAAERAVAQMRAYDQEEGDRQTNREPFVQELRSVLERTEGLHAEAGELAQILDRLDRAEPEPRTEAFDDLGAGPARFTGRSEGPDSGPDSSGGAPAEGVRLLATQMVVAGSDRAEVEQRLARDFGVRDADSLLDELFRRDVSGAA